VDTMSHFEGWGWWSGSASAAPNGLEGLTNQYAALPSLHCAWSLWCGFLLVRFGRRPLLRVLGALYPAATLFVVMSTSNHYLLDAVAGWAVLGVAAGAVALVAGWRSRVGFVGSAAGQPAVPEVGSPLAPNALAPVSVPPPSPPPSSLAPRPHRNRLPWHPARHRRLRPPRRPPPAWRCGSRRWREPTERTRTDRGGWPMPIRPCRPGVDLSLIL
ncbi:phosphatase PAP2 family protein, partial [Frankia sp. CcWB2]